MTTTFHKPDFLGIGPPKTGTTWIYRNLALHPQVAMPPDKEIRYFWERVYAGELSYRQRRASDHWHHQARRVFCGQRFNSHRRALSRYRLDARALWWDLRYCFGPHNDAWYSSLFERECVSGDISAKYCELPDSEVKRISARFPRLKVIITLRDPVAREWSRARMNLCKRKNRRPEAVGRDEFIAEFRDPPQYQANDYRRLIALWRRHFGSGRTLILFYDELEGDPVSYFGRLCDFLEIDMVGAAERRRLHEFVFKGVGGDMPADLRSTLIAMHRPRVEELRDYLPDVEYPRAWLESYG